MNTLKGLTPADIEQYTREGFIPSITVFEGEEIAMLHDGFDRLCQLLFDGETPYVMDGWEKQNTWLYDLVMHPRILDCIEDLLGPDFYQWGSNIMCKMPFEGLYVPWHQDCHDWPLRPLELVTAWLAFDDADEENGCLRMVPRSHLLGEVRHHCYRPGPRGGQAALLPFHTDEAFFDATESVALPLKAGQMSLHHPLTIHCSDGNDSARRRCGIQICYASTNVRGDASTRNENGDWSDFAVFVCRGHDRLGLNRHAPPPTGFGRGPRKVYRELGDLSRPS